MTLMTEQHISAQEWTCDRCGGHDPKSCGCAGATATSRELQATKREANRQAARRSYAKSKQNQRPSHNETNTENTHESSRVADWDEFTDENGSPVPVDLKADQACHERALLFLARESLRVSTDLYEARQKRGWTCTKEMRDAAKAAAAAWTKLWKQMEPSISTA